MVHPFPLPLIPAVAAMSPAYSHSFPSAVALTHVCVKVSWQLLPWVWKGQPPSLPNLTSSLSYDSLSLCHLFCSSLALCLQATTDGVFSDCSWRWLCRAAGVLSCSSPLFSLFYFCLSSSMRTQEPLKENPGGTNCVSRKADSFKGNFQKGSICTCPTVMSFNKNVFFRSSHVHLGWCNPLPECFENKSTHTIKACSSTLCKHPCILLLSSSATSLLISQVSFPKDAHTNFTAGFCKNNPAS